MIEFVHYMYVTSYGYLEWQDKQLTPNMVTIIMDLKDKLNIMKVEKKQIEKIVDWMEEVGRDNLKNENWRNEIY